ncbi:MAG: PAS domain S-box protein, partial [Actinobacteria bacterium]|nr:PAS domain S-box protein [Actinomycetota bacterium]
SWSDETYQIYGYAPGEFAPTVDKLMELVHPDDRNLVRKNIDVAIHESEPYDFEHRIVRPDGEERVIHRQAEIVFDEGGEALRMIGTVHDLTARRRAEEKLKESEGRFRSLIQNSSDITTILEEDGAISYKSPAVERVLGYGQEEMLGERVFDYVHPEDVEYVRRTFAANLESPGANPPVQFRFRHADRSWRYVEAVRNNLLDDPNVRGVVVNTRDITERKEAEKALKESEERYRAVVKQTAEAIFLVDGETKRIQEYNAKFQELLGYTPEDLREITLYEIVAHNRESVDSNIRDVLEKKKHSIGERTYRRKDGSLVDLEVNANCISYDGREVMCIVARDITERKQAEEKLRESEERHRAVIEQSVEGIYLFNPDDGRVLESNEAFENLLGYTSQELLGMTIYDFIAHEREDIDRNVQRDYRERQRHKGERKYRRKDGSLLEVEASAAVIPYRDEEALCCVLHDITERKALEEQLRHQAFHDSLTELPNRALFLDRLGHALTRARRESGPVAVLLMDLNDFKVINDSLGHDAGNAVLIEIAKRLRSCVRSGDTAGRIFGDEFAMLLKAPAGMEEARRIAERIQEGLQKPFDVDGQEVFVSSSIGISLSDPIDKPKGALRHADLAMYEAKSRNAHYEVYEPSMDTRVVNRMDLERDLRWALESEQFEIHYQPVIELETGEVAGFEALARWRHPERGLVAAEEFIHLAEETGLIRPIGQLVLEEACRQGKEWR